MRIRIDKHFENEKTAWKPYFLKRWSGRIWVFCWFRRSLVIDFRKLREISKIITWIDNIFINRKN